MHKTLRFLRFSLLIAATLVISGLIRQLLKSYFIYESSWNEIWRYHHDNIQQSLLFIFLVFTTYKRTWYFLAAGLVAVTVKLVLLIAFYTLHDVGIYSTNYNHYYDDVFGGATLYFNALLFGNIPTSLAFLGWLYVYWIFAYCKALYTQFAAPKEVAYPDLPRHIKTLRISFAITTLILLAGFTINVVTASRSIAWSDTAFSREWELYYISFVSNILLFLIILRTTWHYTRPGFVIAGFWGIAVKLLLLLNWFIAFQPTDADPYDNVFYASFFKSIGLTAFADFVFGENTVSLVVVSAVYSYWLYLYFKIIRFNVLRRNDP